MTELSKSFEAKRQDGFIISCPITATQNIYKGALVCWSTSGYLVPAANTANYILAGVAVETSEAVSGESDGDRKIRVFRNGVFKIPASSATQVWIRRQVFVVDDNTVSLQTTNSVLAGVVVKYVDSSNVRVDIKCATLGTWTEESTSSSSSSESTSSSSSSSSESTSNSISSSSSSSSESTSISSSSSSSSESTSTSTSSSSSSSG